MDFKNIALIVVLAVVLFGVINYLNNRTSKENGNSETNPGDDDRVRDEPGDNPGTTTSVPQNVNKTPSNVTHNNKLEEKEVSKTTTKNVQETPKTVQPLQTHEYMLEKEKVNNKTDKLGSGIKTQKGVRVK